MRTPLLLYGLAFLVRAFFMVQYPDPGYPDSYYYVDVARALAAGHGLNVDFVWIFAEVGGHLPADPVLPIPSNAHWLPLASFIQAPFVLLMGPTAIASALPMVLIGSLAAPLTWLIARDVGASRTVQLGAGVLGAIPAAGAVFMAQPENFAIFQPLVAATLWLAARGLRGDRRAFALAGLLVGLASIARNDAFLLGGAIGLVFVWDRVRAWRTRGAPAIPLASAIACLALFLLVVGPWWYRQLSVFGSISPTASSGSALWLTEYRQWNSITADTSFAAFLAQGPGQILASRVFGFLAAAANFAVIIGSRGAGALHRLGRLAPARLERFPAVVPVRPDHVRGRDAHLPAARSGRGIHPFGRGHGAPRLHPRPRGDGRDGAGDRPAPAGLEPETGGPDLHLVARGVRRRSPRSCTHRSRTRPGHATATTGSPWPRSSISSAWRPRTG